MQIPGTGVNEPDGFCFYCRVMLIFSVDFRCMCVLEDSQRVIAINQISFVCNE